MELEIVEGLVSRLGFPIVVSIILLWNNRETIKHYERLLMEYRTAIENNTNAINGLVNEMRVKK